MEFREILFWLRFFGPHLTVFRALGINPGSVVLGTIWGIGDRNPGDIIHCQGDCYWQLCMPAHSCGSYFVQYVLSVVLLEARVVSCCVYLALPSPSLHMYLVADSLVLAGCHTLCDSFTHMAMRWPEKPQQN